MNVKFLNPFVEAAADVLRVEAGATIERGNLTLAKSSLTTDDITVLINLVGQVQGVVLYGMSTKTGMGLVSRMMGQEFTEFDALAQSGVAEIGNVISGSATVKLAEAGFHSTISTPTMIIGNSVQISTLDFPRIILPLHTEFGDLVIHLAIREAPAGTGDINYVPLIQGVVTKK
jgi:chemotaxis protein CheX